MLLLAAIVGSGVMGERLSGGNVAVALLANTIATGAMLVAIIFAFGRISGRGAWAGAKYRAISPNNRCVCGRGRGTCHVWRDSVFSLPTCTSRRSPALQ